GARPGGGARPLRGGRAGGDGRGGRRRPPPPRPPAAHRRPDHRLAGTTAHRELSRLPGAGAAGRAPAAGRRRDASTPSPEPHSLPARSRPRPPADGAGAVRDTGPGFSETAGRTAECPAARPVDTATTDGRCPG